MEPIILIGGGGHCLSCIDVLEMGKEFEIAGILDISDKSGSSIAGIKVIGTDEDIPLLVSRYKNFLITIGQIKYSDKRVRIYNTVIKYGGNLPVIISPRAYVSPSAVINPGTIIMSNSFVNAKVVIGRGCIVNTGALIEHEVVIGDFCHISTHAVVNGQATVGNCSFIGSNSVIANNVYYPKT